MNQEAFDNTNEKIKDLNYGIEQEASNAPVQKTLRQLFFPIFGEMLLIMLVGSVDTLMLSGVGDDKVGAVGATNTYIALFIMAFSIISNGMLAVMTQYIGAGKEGVARQAKQIGILFNSALGLTVSLLLLFGAKPVLTLLSIAPGLMDDSITYMKIAGGSSILIAITPVYTSYLRAFGYTKEPLIANVLSNGTNILLNALFLYGFQWGVAGVAWATVISRIIALLIVMIISGIRIRLPKDAECIPAKEVCLNILKIGFPSALETVLYDFAMALVMKFINQMSDDGIYVTVKSYATQIINFSYCASAALANANAVRVGWKIGEKKLEECGRDTFRVVKIGIGISVSAAIVIALLGSRIMLLFTSDEEVIRLVSVILIVDIILEIGRTANLVFGCALKISGDAVYTVTIAVVVMYLVAVLGTYILGIELKWYIVGSWIMLALDECTRAVLMGLRWKSNKWHKKVLIK